VSIDVERADESELEKWDDYVSRSPMGTLFHTDAVLTVLAEHSGATLHRLIGKKGQEVRGVLPLFEIRKGPVKTLFSPSPQLGVPNLGPVLVNHEKLKQRKRERTNRRFVENSLEWVADEIDPKFVRLETVTDYVDTRPFQWNEFDVTPRHTYELDLSGGKEAMLSNFKSNLRSDIRRHEDADYRVYEGDEDAIRFIIRQVRNRYEEQGKTYGIQPEYVIDLYRALPEGSVRPYVGEANGERLGGIIVLEYGSRCYYWQGGGKPDVPIPINDLIHWRIIRDAFDRDVETYDLTGANTRRISRYKSKFNPDLVPYYALERGTRTMNIVSDVYRKLR